VILYSLSSICLLAGPNEKLRQLQGLERPEGSEFGVVVQAEMLPRSRQASPDSSGNLVPRREMMLGGRGIWGLARSKDTRIRLPHH